MTANRHLTMPIAAAVVAGANGQPALIAAFRTEGWNGAGDGPRRRRMR
jgi:hypothetical protein